METIAWRAFRSSTRTILARRVGPVGPREIAGRARGKVLNVHRALANRPEALEAFTGFVQTVYRGNSTLHPKHGELAYLTATAVNNCFY